MISEGSICIWQNQVGHWSYLNGLETTVTKGLHYADTYDGASGIRKHQLVYATDTNDLDNPEDCLYAAPHDIRLKDPDDDDLARELVLDRLEENGLRCYRETV